MKLLTEARMLFKPALGPNRRADFESCEISDNGDAAEIVVLARNEYNGDRVAVVVVREQNLIEDALERLGRMLSLSHANRITRIARRVQLERREASTCSSMIPPSLIAPSPLRRQFLVSSRAKAAGVEGSRLPGRAIESSRQNCATARF